MAKPRKTSAAKLAEKLKKSGSLYADESSIAAECDRLGVDPAGIEPAKFIALILKDDHGKQ